ncbi:hypothetical protein CC80DRAFT_555518 [Byssothecium circinans]|uniref:Uncharacterized protein n=1 Tax=Byssothecium circinans TaxID=147558 RepID=A0A6A5TCC9_9PLEO|nr:hypothetical protein CC80DRAFT_555518 [Byssothecium circinans]
MALRDRSRSGSSRRIPRRRTEGSLVVLKARGPQCEKGRMMQLVSRRGGGECSAGRRASGPTEALMMGDGMDGAVKGQAIDDASLLPIPSNAKNVAAIEKKGGAAAAGYRGHGLGLARPRHRRCRPNRRSRTRQESASVGPVGAEAITGRALQ